MPASYRVAIAMGKLASVDSTISGDEEKYEGVEIILAVCRRCFRLYHLNSDIYGWLLILIPIVGVGYGIWGFALDGLGMALAYGLGSALLIALFIGFFYNWTLEKILRWLWGPERFARKHPQYPELKQRGYTTAFYIDRRGKAETKLSIALEDLG